MHRLVLFLIIITFVFLVSQLPDHSENRNLSAVSANDCDSFRETGFSVCGKFRTFWHEHGGLPIFGFPISDEFIETSDLNGVEHTVQYFERAIFELHPENTPPNDVQLAQIANCYFRERYPAGPPDDKSRPVLLISDTSYRLYPLATSELQELASELDSYSQRTAVVHYPTTADRLIGLSFDTTDKPDAVDAFYDSILSQHGWRKKDNNGSSGGITYYLGDNSKGDVFTYELDLSKPVTQPSPNHTHVEVVLRKGLPLMPNAQNVQLEEASVFEGITSSAVFTTAYPADEITVFYRDVLAKDGWKLVGYGPGRTMNFARSGASPPTGMSIEVSSTCTNHPQVTIIYAGL